MSNEGMAETDEAKPCPECGSHEVSTNTELDAHICRECDHRWADTTATERALRLAISGDEIALEGVGDDLIVDYVSAARDEMSARGDETTYRAELDDAGSATVIDIDSGEEVASGVTVRHDRDAWAA